MSAADLSAVRRSRSSRISYEQFLNSGDENLHRMYLEGPADLVVEIICHESRTLDSVQKFREYEQGGVREYWLIDPERREAEFYRRGRDGRFRLAHVGNDAVFRSRVLKGLWLRIEWLWDRPPV